MEINIKITEKDLQEHPEILHIIHCVVPETEFTASEPEEPAKADFLEKKFNLPEPQEAPAEKEMPAEPEADPVEEEKPAEGTTKEYKFTLEDVRSAVSAYAKKHSAAQAKAILVKHGANKVTDLKSDSFEAVIKECEV